MNWIKNNKSAALCCVVIAVILLIFLYPFIKNNQQEKKITIQSSEGNEALPENDSAVEEDNKHMEETIIVDVKGAVKYPGVYEAKKEERVVDVIKRAGGITEKGEEKSINLALKVADEMVIYVPFKGEEDIQGISNAGAEGVNGKQDDLIELNKATAADLETLPGIGPAKAETIIQYREENGGFSTKEDLKKISGIGEKTYEKLADLIKVNEK
ncbi:MAG: helix-hairpin-helix domain-containing protein [Bacillus sp. (in: firmicutes)]